MEAALLFDWDGENAGHIFRHDVTMKEVEEVFANDPMDIEFEVAGEDRWTSIGHSDLLRVLVVVWTDRGRAMRPVTAYGAGKRVTREYLAMKGL